MSKGLLIALEGIDGTGITTQAARLAAWLRKRAPTVLTKEPTEGPIGLLIRRALQGDLPGVAEDVMALLFAADRIDHAREVILPALERGENVITDRYLLSTYAYQSLHLDLPWLRELNDPAPRPDATFLLTVDPKTSARRILERSQKERYEDEAHLETVLATYQSLARVLGDELHIHVVDGEGPEEEVTGRLIDALSSLLDQKVN